MSADLNACAAVFRALSHPVRLTLLRLTWTEPLGGERLAALTGLAPATVSHHLAQLTEPGQRYPECEVNALLAEWHKDFFTLRRDLVGLDLLAREGGVYWRVERASPPSSP